MTPAAGAAPAGPTDVCGVRAMPAGRANPAAYRAAVIFDVDGVLLHLKPAEENALFASLRDVHGITGASRDWNSYRVRNDLAIIAELIERRYGRPPAPGEVEAVCERYLERLAAGLGAGSIATEAVAGAGELLAMLARLPDLALGIATANLEGAARARLRHAGLWEPLAVNGFAEAGGPKANILRHVLARLEDGQGSPLPRERIVYVGDNLNDLEAGRANGVHFIGFSVEAEQRMRLEAAGARQVLGDHAATRDAIHALLNFG